MSKLPKALTIVSCFIFISVFMFSGSAFAQICTDVDGDGYGLNGDASCTNAGVDCDDGDANVYPNAPRICDAKDSDCDGWQDFFTDRDDDGDGVPLCASDCDDNDPNRFPGNYEIFGNPNCSDGIDNDCDYKKDASDYGCFDNCSDNDGDGYANPGHPSCPNGPETDCDDDDPLINPGADDSNCDGIDDNCDGTPDEGYVPTPIFCGIGECARSGWRECGVIIIGVESDICTPGLPVKEGPLGDATCSDSLDNDCDGLVDGADPGCLSDCLDDDNDGYGYNGHASCPNAGVDCDDDNAAINPAALDDNCDNIDDNCSGLPDEGYAAIITNCGIGECANSGLLECQTGALVDTCIPGPPDSPWSPIWCSDTLDNDCDGDVDVSDLDECPPPTGTDNDGDGFCADPSSCTDGSTPGDCDDSDINIYPGAPRICDGKDSDCDGFSDSFADRDSDGDGAPLCVHWQTGLQDCDDNNPNRYPGNQEGPFGDPTCADGIDNDCDFKKDAADMQCKPGCTDGDSDGYGNPGSGDCPNGAQTDCNDTNPAINPGASDADCDNVDDNCSGTPDDQYVATTTNCGTGECATTGQLTCSGGLESDDCTPLPSQAEICGNLLDDDCDTLIDGSDPACASCQDNDLDGYGATGDLSCTNAGIDCDDNNAAINPGIPDDTCDGVDDNCSGTADDEYVPSATNCGVGECATTGQLICNASVPEDNCTPLPPQPEICGNGLDDDCDGIIDNPSVCNPVDTDDDGDGYCEVGPCTDGSTPGDCDDLDPNTYAGALRICDAKDNDCDGYQDFFTDVDKDGDGVPMCVHYLTGLQDCDDNNSSRFPGNQEGPFGNPTCGDGVDNDCSYKIDMMDPVCWDQCNDSDGDGYGCPPHPSCPGGALPDCDCNDPTIHPAVIDTNCNAVDENCDGTPDEGYIVTPTNCGTGECASTGTLSCVGGVETDSCVPGPPVPEGPLGDAICADALDNDCDTLIDGSDPGCLTACLDDDGDGYGVNGDPTCTFPGVDCDDSNPLINPGGDDANCNGIDEDCNGTPDDGFVGIDIVCGIGDCQGSAPPICVDGVIIDTCIPLPPQQEGPAGHPSCSDGIDNDCDGLVDLADPDCNDTTVDNDGDGYCDDVFCTDGSSPLDCDDTDPLVYPGATRICDGKDNDCDGMQDFFTDKDDDGDGVTLCTHWLTGLQDCDDNNPNRFPGNIENDYCSPGSCFDGIDNNCNYKIDLADISCSAHCPDCDKDGYSPMFDPFCLNPADIDCDDSNPDVFPGATEGPFGDPTCSDGLDNNCDGSPDAGDDNCQSLACTENVDCQPGLYCEKPLGTCAGVGVCLPLPGTCTAVYDPVCGCNGTSYSNDCYASIAGTNVDYTGACGSPTCLDIDGDGYGYYGDVTCPNPGADCDDTDPAINPGASDDVCDGIDVNCSGTADDDYVPTVTNCGVGECATTGQMVCTAGALADNCTPLAPGTEGPFGDPTCSDSLDNDCDGDTDVVDIDCNPCMDDNDGDGYCDGPVCGCGGGGIPGDCDDTDPLVHPGGDTTICDGKDTNCDGFRDFFSDRDDDGDGVPMCAHWQTGLQDCDDSNANRSPNILENDMCNPTSCSDSIDNDCDYTTDGSDLSCRICKDCDEDGYGDGTSGNAQCGSTADDCNDGDPAVNPGVTEGPLGDPTCGDGIDNDCDGLTDDLDSNCIACVAGIDLDGDGFDNCTDGDCDDSDPNVYPGAPLLCDAKDNDCDAMLDFPTDVDEDFDGIPLCAGDCDDNDPFITCCDNDLDGYGSPGETFCPNGSATDCNDNNGAINPGASDDDCNNVDDNCSGSPDEGYVATPTNCGTGECSSSGQLECQSGVIVDTCAAGAPGVEGPEGDPTCSDILDNDCDGLTDIVDPDCTAAADAPHNIITDCTVCHDPGTYVPGGAIQNSKCEQCHTPSGSLKGGYPTAPDVMTHYSNFYNDPTTGQLVNIDCVECHNPMRPQVNLRHIRGVIRGIPVIFTAITGVNSFADGGVPYDGICEVCHTQTNHHQNDGTAPGGQSHNDGTDCTACHTHPDGFVGLPPDCFGPHDIVTDCTICHDPGTYIPNPPIPDSRCQSCHDIAAPGAAAGGADTKVETHSGSTYGAFTVNCVECHNDHCNSNNIKLVRSVIAGSQIVFTAYTGTGSFADGPPYKKNICDTCHTQTNHHRSDGSTAAHNDGTDCTACHSHTNSYYPQ